MPDTPNPPPSLFRSFRHRNYRLFFSGQLVSLLGTWMQSVAQAWLVYQLTHSAVLLGLTGFIGQIPGFFVAPIGGIVADRHRRHRIVIATQTCAMALALVLAALTLTHVVQVWHILVLSGLLGVVNAFDIPARQSFIADIVGPHDRANAIALNSSMVTGSRIIGPAIAGVLVAIVGEGWCFLLNGISYIAVIAGLLAMTLPPHTPVVHTASPLEQMREGFRFATDTLPVRSLLILLGIVSLAGMPYAVLMPIFAKEVLHGNAQTMGILMSMAGAGALLGAISLTLRRELRGLGRWIAVSAATFGTCLIAFSQSRAIWLSAILLIPVGFSMQLQMSGTNTLLQAMVPNRLRGRLMSMFVMMFLGMAPVGSLLAGGLAKFFGAPMTVALGGVACLVGAALFWRKLPALRAQAAVVLSERELEIEAIP